MKPWFLKDADIIQFPKRKADVVTLPNVNSYPDFISGVRDLQSKLKNKTISTDSYNKLYTDLITRFRLKNESAQTPWFLREYQTLDQAKKEIIAQVTALNPEDEETGKQSADLLDKIYSILNKNNTVNRLQTVVDKTLGNEYKETDLVEIAKTIAGAPIQYQDKLTFINNLQNDKCINHKLLTAPGNHSLDDLLLGSSINDAVFRHLLNYGRGKQSKGAGEHALAIMSKKITIQGKGDINVAGVPVELKVAITTGGGRFGEIAPSRQDMLGIINGISQIREPINQYLQNQKSINVAEFTRVVNELNLPPKTRRSIGSLVFGKIFANYANDLVTSFSKSNASPDEILRQYVKANFNYYKGTEQGGQWEILCAMSISKRRFAVISDGEQLINGTVSMMKNTPALIPTRPSDMLFQANPR
tara:strand:+ start:20 stop:1270 length:1251 start_codon:yes stop_codon:yes gene_type:complete